MHEVKDRKYSSKINFLEVKAVKKRTTVIIIKMFLNTLELFGSRA